MEGFITNIQPFSLQDGPGIRTTVFMKGCNLRCYWCHNPEAISPQPVIQFFEKKCIGCKACVQACPHSSNGHTARNSAKCELCGNCVNECFAEALVLTGQKVTSEELMERIEKDREIFERSGGGVTFSGGEPALQPVFLFDILCRCRERKISTAIETALNVQQEIVAQLAEKVDYFICDLKALNSEKHRLGTGVDNVKILNNIAYLAKNHRSLLVRTPIVPGFNDTIDDMKEHAAFLSSLEGNLSVELLPFHGICMNKYKSLEMDYQAAGQQTPGCEKMRQLAEPFLRAGLQVKY